MCCSMACVAFAWAAWINLIDSIFLPRVPSHVRLRRNFKPKRLGTRLTPEAYMKFRRKWARKEWWAARALTFIIDNPVNYIQLGSSVRQSKSWGGGGSPASRDTFGYWKGHLKFFSQSCWGGGRKNFPVIPHRNQIDQIFKKTLKFPNKKCTFDVNLLFTVILACSKKNFYHKKGHFSLSLMCKQHAVLSEV
jgi:hypothetical protein